MTERPCEGLLLVDKPAGPTSHDIVNRVRRACGVRRVGHAGTLDPMASGLLPLVIGRATRLVRFLPDGPKVYRGTLRLGIRTTTDDVTGEVIERHAGALPPAARVHGAATGLLGLQSQRAPDYSAKRVAGRRLYEMARKGVPVAAPSAEVEVRRFELTPTERPEVYEFEAEVSRGTYIRALARDLGLAIDCGATLAALVRTRIGPLRLEDAEPWPATPPGRSWVLDALLPVERMPLLPPPLQLAGHDEARRFALGAVVRLERVPDASAPELVRVLDPAGVLLGIGSLGDDGLRPRVVLATPDEGAGEP